MAAEYDMRLCIDLTLQLKRGSTSNTASVCILESEVHQKMAQLEGSCLWHSKLGILRQIFCHSVEYLSFLPHLTCCGYRAWLLCPCNGLVQMAFFVAAASAEDTVFDCSQSSIEASASHCSSDKYRAAAESLLTRHSNVTNK